MTTTEEPGVDLLLQQTADNAEMYPDDLAILLALGKRPAESPAVLHVALQHIRNIACVLCGQGLQPNQPGLDRLWCNNCHTARTTPPDA